MATCDEIALLLSRGLDGDLSKAETALMYAHIAGCDACRHAMGEIAALELALRELDRNIDAATLDDGFVAELAAKLDAARGDSNITQLRQFGRRAAQDAALRDKLQAAKDHASFISLYVRLGMENGYSFTAEQVESQLGLEAANDSELSDEQLDRVAGGISGFDGQKLLDFLNRLDS